MITERRRISSSIAPRAIRISIAITDNSSLRLATTLRNRAKKQPKGF